MYDNLELAHRIDGDTAVIEVDGALVYDTAPRLRELLRDLMIGREIRWIAVNLEQCALIDNSGFGVLVGAWKRLEELNGRIGGDWKRLEELNGCIVLICTQDRLLRVLRMNGLAKVFPIADSEPVALAMLQRKREDKAFGQSDRSAGDT